MASTGCAAGVSCKSLASFSAVSAALTILKVFQRSGQSWLVTCTGDDDLYNHKQGDHGACPVGFLQMSNALIAFVAGQQIHSSFPQVSDSACES